MRHRFNKERICSSENYELSKKLHNNYLREFHNIHIVEIEQLVIMEKKKYFVSVFGKLIEISESEAFNIKDSVRVITL